jgi:hypothetical protein
MERQRKLLNAELATCKTPVERQKNRIRLAKVMDAWIGK